jgi:hypothetical protein
VKRHCKGKDELSSLSLELFGNMKRLKLASLALMGAVLSSFAAAGPGDGDLLSLLKQTNSRSALNLSAGVLGQIDQLFNTMDKQISDLLSKAAPDIKVGGFSIGKAPSPDGLRNKIQGEFRGQMMKLLDPNQLKQALQMGIKAEGNFAFLMPDVAKDIKLDKNAKKALEGFRKEYFDLDKVLKTDVAAGKLSDSDRLKQLLEKDGALQEAISKVVTPEQIEQLKKLAGS